MATKQPKIKAPPPPALVEIETRAKSLADARAVLAKAVQALKEGIKKVTDRHIDDLRTTAAEVGVATTALQEVIDKHPELFVSPRSKAFHGLTVGYKKQAGRITYEDETKVIARIEKSLPDQLDTLAPATRKLSHTALETLDAKVLKSIGAAISDTDDKAFIRTPADDVDKFANSIVGAYTAKTEAAAQ